MLAACSVKTSPHATPSVTPLSSNGALGSIERSPLILEPPVENVDLTVICDRWRPAWRLSGFNAAQFDSLLESVGVPRAMRESIATVTHCSADSCDVRPDPEWVSNLPTKARVAIYRQLLSNPGDARHVVWFSRPKEDAELWSSDHLEPATRAAIDDLSFDLDGSVTLPDPAVLCARVPSREQRLQAFATLGRTRTFLSKLLLDRRSDIDAVARYWGETRREQNVRSLLASLHETDGRKSIELLYLLPPMARAHLMKFPTPGAPPLDCHWTTLNFDNPLPEEKPLDWPTIKGAFDHDFEPAPSSDLHLGDVVLFTSFFDGSEHYVHSAVYVAGGLVFGRNGGTSTSPWALMQLDHVIARYRPITTAVRFLRRKG